MDPSHRGSYQDDGEVRIVVDMFDQMPPTSSNTVYGSDVAGASATQRQEIDLNNPAQQEVDSPVHALVGDAQEEQAPDVHDYSGNNYGSGNYGTGNYGSSNYSNSSGDGYVDWARGSIDVAPDGKLAFYENVHPPTEPAHSHGDTGFDLNAAVREAQERDEAYCQERLENLRKGKAMEDQFLDTSFRDSPPAEDPGYFKLWND